MRGGKSAFGREFILRLHGKMERTASVRPAVRRRHWAAWLLVLFSLAQAMPVAALAAGEEMGAMPCCKRGKDNCCRRKPMHQGPGFRAGHPCGMPCAGTPTAPVRDTAAAAVPETAGHPAPLAAPAAVPARTAIRMANGYDAARFQRPPPVMQFQLVFC